MKTQISNLINGSENTIRNINAAKYANNPIGFFTGKDNVPQFGGTPVAERKAVADAVASENPEELDIDANGVALTLGRHNSVSGKSWNWETEISAEQFSAISGMEAPVRNHKGARNSYSIMVNGDCTVVLYATSGRKSLCEVLGEEFITIK